MIEYKHMSVQVVTCFLGKEIRRAPFILGVKPLRTTAEISGCDAYADIARVIIKPDERDSIIEIVESFGVPPQPASRKLTREAINQANLEADLVWGLIHRSLVYTPD